MHRRVGSLFARRLGHRSRPEGGGVEYLLDYAGATFTRSSEASAVDPRDGWAWYDLATPWPGVDVPRILSDGAILIEGSRTNLVVNGRDFTAASWDSKSGHTVTANAVAGPDGLTLADRVQLASGGFIGDTIGNLADFAVASVYLRAGPTHVDPARQFFGAGTPNPTVISAHNLTAQMTRYMTGELNPTTGATDFYYPLVGSDTSAYPNGGAAKAQDAYADLAQVEGAARFASSPIRTSGAAGTRAAESATVPEASYSAALRSSGFVVDVWPEWIPGAAPGTFQSILRLDDNNRVYVSSAGAFSVVRGGVTTTLPALAWASHQKITITVVWGAGGSFAASADGGGSETAAITGDWTGAGSLALEVGHRASTTQHLFGAISRPRAA